MLVVKIEFYTLDFLSWRPAVFPFLPSLFFLFLLRSSFSRSTDPLFFLRSSFSKSTDLNQTPRTNPFILHSPHQPNPNQTQNKPLRSSFSPSLCHCLGSIWATAWSLLFGSHFPYLLGLCFCLSLLLGLCLSLCFIVDLCFRSLCWVCVSVQFHFTKLEPQRLDLAYQKSSFLDSRC